MVADVPLGLYAQEFPDCLHDFSSEMCSTSELTLDGSPNLEKIWFIKRQVVV